MNDNSYQSTNKAEHRPRYRNMKTERTDHPFDRGGAQHRRLIAISDNSRPSDTIGNRKISCSGHSSALLKERRTMYLKSAVLYERDLVPELKKEHYYSSDTTFL